MAFSLASFAADSILIVHALFVAFVVGGFFAVWAGAGLGWSWVRNFWLRATHLAAISAVALESLTGIPCPLTVWEDRLRGISGGSGFIERLVHPLLFYDAPPWAFNLAYVLFALAVLVTFWAIPPRFPWAGGWKRKA